MGNKLDIKTYSGTSETGAYYFGASLYIDEDLIASGKGLDFGELIRSSLSSGEYFIATCSCGDSFCANIDIGVYVLTDEWDVVWFLKEPIYSNPKVKQKDEELIFKRYQFDRKQYQGEIEKAISEFNNYVKGKKEYSGDFPDYCDEKRWLNFKYA